MKLPILISLLITTSCAGSFEMARLSRPVAASVTPEDRARCQSLDNKRRWESVASTVGVALSGASGISAIPVDNDTARVSLLIGSGVIAAVSVVLAKFSDDDAVQWAKECGQ